MRAKSPFPSEVMGVGRLARLPAKGRTSSMEIERVISGDLNKNIEQCVNALMDVERKVHSLKSELAQTLTQLQVARGGTPQGSLLGAPTTLAQGSLPQAFYGVPQPFYGVPQTALGWPTSGYQAPAGYPAVPWGFGAPFAPRFGLQSVPLPSYPAFAQVQGIPGVTALPSYNYIW